jgi:hypothetical protein
MAPYFPAEATVAAALLVAVALFRGALGVVVAFSRHGLGERQPAEHPRRRHTCR